VVEVEAVLVWGVVEEVVEGVLVWGVVEEVVEGVLVWGVVVQLEMLFHQKYHESQ
jgi:hypothetical protein